MDLESLLEATVGLFAFIGIIFTGVYFQLAATKLFGNDKEGK